MDNSIFASQRRLKIAVIGTGIAGMSAAWLLNQGHDVTVFETNDRPGGHSNTVDAALEDVPVPVDTGFIVYNERNYPNLTALFDHLGVETAASNMSFAASLDQGRLEYAGSDLNSLLGQRRNILRPRFWRMVRELLRFYREAPDALADDDIDSMSLDEYLAANGYSEAFVTDHLLPMGAAIWSTTAREMRAYPAGAFIRFFQSHGLLSIKDRPAWRTVRGGSRAYVEKLIAPYRNRIRYTGVRAVLREPGGVVIVDETGSRHRFDHAVIATHADEAFSLLDRPTGRERALLGCWRYTQNRAVLHTDASLMPRRRRVWSSWNFLGSRSETDGQALCVSYWMNRLQPLDTETDVFVTLNPLHEPDRDTVLGEFSYSHPFFNRAALASQKDLWSLQGQDRVWFCGSYFGYGFHEDALQSGLAVAELLGGMRRPWTVAQESGRISLTNTSPVEVLAAQ